MPHVASLLSIFLRFVYIVSNYLMNSHLSKMTYTCAAASVCSLSLIHLTGFRSGYSIARDSLRRCEGLANQAVAPDWWLQASADWS